MAVNKFVDKFFKKIFGTNSEVFLKKTVDADRSGNQ